MKLVKRWTMITNRKQIVFLHTLLSHFLNDRKRLQLITSLLEKYLKCIQVFCGVLFKKINRYDSK